MLEGKNSEFLGKRGTRFLTVTTSDRHTGIGEFTIRNSGNDSRFGKKNELHFRKFTTEKKKILIAQKVSPFSMTQSRDHSHYSSTVSVRLKMMYLCNLRNVSMCGILKRR